MLIKPLLLSMWLGVLFLVWFNNSALATCSYSSRPFLYALICSYMLLYALICSYMLLYALISLYALVWGYRTVLLLLFSWVLSLASSGLCLSCETVWCGNLLWCVMLIAPLQSGSCWLLGLAVLTLSDEISCLMRFADNVWVFRRFLPSDLEGWVDMMTSIRWGVLVPA